jgi:site-specific recombinase XerD
MTKSLLTPTKPTAMPNRAAVVSSPQSASTHDQPLSADSAASPSSQPSSQSLQSSLPSRQPLTHKFRDYLRQRGLAAASIKNYVSDVDGFLEWLANNLQEDILEPRQLTQTAFDDYSRWLNAGQNHVHPATANRYLSSLRSFGEFLVNQNFTTTNPTVRLSNQHIDPTIDQVLNEFKNELARQKLSPSTIKNYYSDVKQYLLWAKDNIKITDNKLDLLS